MTKKSCRDCNVELSAINILDQRGPAAPVSGLAYTSGEAGKKSSWTGKIKNRIGTIRAWVCDECLRVEFYAEPE